MIVDKDLEFSVDQAITSLGQTIGTNVIDLTKSGPAVGDLFVLAQVTEAFDSTAGDTTLKVMVDASEVSDFSTSEKLFDGPVHEEDDLVVGKVVCNIDLPSSATGRYIRVRYYTTNSAPSAGKVSCRISRENDFKLTDLI